MRLRVRIIRALLGRRRGRRSRLVLASSLSLLVHAALLSMLLVNASGPEGNRRDDTLLIELANGDDAGTRTNVKPAPPRSAGAVRVPPPARPAAPAAPPSPAAPLPTAPSALPPSLPTPPQRFAAAPPSIPAPPPPLPESRLPDASPIPARSAPPTPTGESPVAPAPAPAPPMVAAQSERPAAQPERPVAAERPVAPERPAVPERTSPADRAPVVADRVPVMPERTSEPREPAPVAPQRPDGRVGPPSTPPGPLVAAVPPSPPTPPPAAPDIRSALRRTVPGGVVGGRGGVYGPPVPLDTREPQYVDYFALIKPLIRAKWIFPCPEGDPHAYGCVYREGEVLAHVAIAKDGHLSYVAMERSSGSMNMDQSALTALQLASPYPPVPDSVSSRGVDIVITFRYMVSDSLVNILLR